MDFVLRCVEHAVLLKYPNTGLKYSYHVKAESSTREQRSIQKISGSDRMWMLLYADDIVLFCEDIQELNCILKIYDENFFSLWPYNRHRQNKDHIIQCIRGCHEHQVTDISKRRGDRKWQKF